jgi:hypothetical protein
MTTRATIAAVLSCAIAGLGAVQPDTPAAHLQQPGTLPEVPQLLGFDAAELAVPQVAGQPFTTEVSLAGQPYTLELEPFSLRAPDFQLLVDRGHGLEPMEPAPPQTYRGGVRGVEGSWVAASIKDGHLWATISLDEDTIWQVEPLTELAPGAPAGLHAIYRDTDSFPIADHWCGTTEDYRVPQDVNRVGDGDGSDGGIAGTGYRIIDYAADADIEFWQKNGSSELNTMLDIELIVNHMSSIYESQLNLTFEITTIVIRTVSDSYSSSVCDTLLNQFTNTWNSAPESSIRRDVAQLYTGRVLTDCLGISWLGSVCSVNWAYSVVESRASGLTLTLRTALSAHELGHSFNASHCCGGCTGCPTCRIMCPCIAGCSGIMTSFGATAVDEITAYANSIGCLADLLDPPDLPFLDEFPSTTLNTRNWTYNNGGFITSTASNEPTPPYSMNLDSVGSNDYQDNELRSNFMNLVGQDGAGVTVRYYTQHVGAEAGDTLYVEYWAGGLWNELNAIVSDGVDQTTFTLWEHDLTGLFPSPFHSEFRIRFRADGDASSDDWYIDDVGVGGDPPPPNDHCENAEMLTTSAAFTTIGATTDGVTESCDGGPQVPFENDVWFVYTAECTGLATFSTCNDADFDTRIAVYDGGVGSCVPFSDLGCSNDAIGCGVTSELDVIVVQGASYLVRIGSGDIGTEGSGTVSVSCAPFAPPCPWDCGQPADGNVGVVDFLALLAEWGQVGTPCDVDGGGVSVNDFLDLIANWGPCP